MTLGPKSGDKADLQLLRDQCWPPFAYNSDKKSKIFEIDGSKRFIELILQNICHFFKWTLYCFKELEAM